MSSSILKSADTSALKPAAELARASNVRFPNESHKCRRAREALLAEGDRASPSYRTRRRGAPRAAPGGEVVKPYAFADEDGPASFADLFGGKNTLHVWPAARAAMPDVHVAPVGVGWRGAGHSAARCARGGGAVADRAAESLQARTWLGYLPLYQDLSGEFSRDYHALTREGGDDAAFNVFTRSKQADVVTMRHFWGGEMNGASADPGQDPRGAPDLMPIWSILDATPDGRGTDWYPKLNY
jgi:predicted dithiol-disulfide oxidoreductase (DUF899 family)